MPTPTHTLCSDVLYVAIPPGPAVQGTWTNFQQGYQYCGFWKDPQGHVHLQGVVNNGAAGTTIFTLPPGYRPGFIEVFSAQVQAGLARVDVTPAGLVIGYGGGGVNYVSLSGLTFLAAA